MGNFSTNLILQLPSRETLFLFCLIGFQIWKILLVDEKGRFFFSKTESLLASCSIYFEYVSVCFEETGFSSFFHLLKRLSIIKVNVEWMAWPLKLGSPVRLLLFFPLVILLLLMIDCLSQHILQKVLIFQRDGNHIRVGHIWGFLTIFHWGSKSF